MGGSLAQALDAGVKLGAHWIEIYHLDGDNVANAKTDRYRGAHYLETIKRTTQSLSRFAEGQCAAG